MKKHGKGQCEFPAKCEVDGDNCRCAHNKLLHGAVTRRTEKKTENVSTTVVMTASNDLTVMTREAGEQSLRLLKLFVRATDGDQNSIRHITALLDGSSSTTILREEVARKLGAKLKLENVDVTSIHGMNTKKMATIKLQISPDCKRWHDVKHAKTTAR